MSAWTHYSATDQQQVDDLLNRYPRHVVADKTGVPKPTIDYWIQQGYVENVDQRYGPDAGWDTVDRADELYDRMPLSQVAEVMGMKQSTLDQWQQKGWITTDTNHRSRSARKARRNRERARRAANLVNDKGLMQREAAEKMDVSQSSISRYLRMYRTGNY
jgi:transcriptional regulator with XRE-family HTH domain